MDSMKKNPVALVAAIGVFLLGFGVFYNFVLKEDVSMARRDKCIGEAGAKYSPQLVEICLSAGQEPDCSSLNLSYFADDVDPSIDAIASTNSSPAGKYISVRNSLKGAIRLCVERFE